MKTAILLLSIFLSTSLSFSQQHLLSNNAEISVLTVASGKQLNDAFGHNAFRIKDTSNNLDIIFDYGRFDFNTPNFYLNFARGHLNYAIGQSTFNRFLRVYMRQNRTIKAQVLNLSKTQKQKLYDFLIDNNKPKNRSYAYDFFFDNCATKIKDVLNNTLNQNIVFENPADFEPKTFRTLINSKLNRNSWESLGIDIALGSVIDIKATPEEHMFLPENIYRFFEVATINNTKPLVKEQQVIYMQKNTSSSSTFFTSPLCILGLLSTLFVFITYTDSKQNKFTYQMVRYFTFCTNEYYWYNCTLIMVCHQS